jgi:hypothetical protein
VCGTVRPVTLQVAETERVVEKKRRPIPGGWLAAVACVPLLFLAYLFMSRTLEVNADAASIATQGWDILHGNVLLRDWTVTDVSFYTNEVLLYVLVELVYGYHGDTPHALAALVFTLLVVVVAAAAKGRATGREGALRAGVAVAIVGVPALGVATVTQLSGPDHTGTAIPLLLTWLVLERFADRRWLPYAVAGMLAWGQIADPLVMYIGVLPLLLASGLRMVRDRQWRGLDARLALAGLGSVLLTQVLLLGIRLAGGFGAHAAPVQLSTDLGNNLLITAKVMAVNFGAYFPDRGGPAGVALAVLHLVGLLATAAAVAVVAVRTLLGRGGDRLAELVVLGVLVNIGAFVVSSLPIDLYSSRQVVAVLPLGAVLAGRVWGPPLARVRAFRRVAVAAVALLALLAGELAAHATARSAPGHGEDVAAWLDDRGYEYGLGEYWNASNVTLLTSGRVEVAPVVGGHAIQAFRWLSKESWYDPAEHDARFMLIDSRSPASTTEARAVDQFGPPVERHQFDGVILLVYEHNLLVGLPAYCVPEFTSSIESCPDHGFPLFG